MTIDELKMVFKTIKAQVRPEQWEIALMSYGYNKRKDICSYQFRLLDLNPDCALPNLVKDICGKCLTTLEEYESIEPYTGITQTNIVYSFSDENELIADSYSGLKKKLANPDDTTKIEKMKMKGYAITGEIHLKNKPLPIKMFSLSLPFKTLKHQFFYSEGTYKEISEPVLSLQTSICLLVIDKTLYMLNTIAEKLFNLDRSFKRVSATHVDQVIAGMILNNPETFRGLATSGFNPRTLISFSNERLAFLQNETNRQLFARKYKLDLDAKGLFITDNPEQVRALVKVLCGKAMEDPMDSRPVEVPSSKAWVTR